jgi:hypothetical protein
MPPVYTFDQKNVRDASTDWQAGQALTIEWEATCDEANVDGGDIISALASIVGIEKGSPHPTYGYARCTNVSARVYEVDPFRWDVRATFLEPRPQPGDPVNPDGGQPEPPDRDPWVSGVFRREDRFPNVDNSPSIPYDAGPPEVLEVLPRQFTNSAGDPFDNPPPVPMGVGGLTITKYYNSIAYFDLLEYQNCCNADDFFDFPPHSLCVMGISWAPHSERGWSGWKVTWNLEHRKVSAEQKQIHPNNLAGTGAGNPFTGPIQDIVGGVGGITGGYHPIALLDIGWNEIDTSKHAYWEPEASGASSPVPGLLNGINGGRASGAHFLAFDMHPRISFAIMEP